MPVNIVVIQGVRNFGCTLLTNFGSKPSSAIVQKIRDRYSAEIGPYDAAITEYRKISGDLEKFAKTEGANLGAVAQQPDSPIWQARVTPPTELGRVIGTRVTP